MDFFVGTLTRFGGEGILLCAVEGDKIIKKEVLSGYSDPGYMICPEGTGRMYVTSYDWPDEKNKGVVNEFDITGEHPVLLAQKPVYAGGNCHLVISPNGKTIYTANYGTGSVSVLPADGGLKEAIQVIQREGTGPDKDRQEAPHPHQVSFVPGTNHLAVMDLGTDQAVVYNADPESGMLTEFDALRLHGGPRHVAWLDETTCYLAHELSNEVSVLKVNQDGKLISAQCLSTLPDGFAGESAAAAVRIRNGKVWVSNRGHGTLAEFDIVEDNLLKLNRFLPAGIFARDFIVLEDGRFLVADQKGGVYLEDCDGKTLDFLPEMGAVCICRKP